MKTSYLLHFACSTSSRALRPGSFTKTFCTLLGAVLILTAWKAQASDPIGLFAMVDKVVFEPNEKSPERIQIWGAFSLADEKNPADYKKPQIGFLYYQLPEAKEDVARKEWNDLKSAAGTGQVIGFGSRYAPKGVVRNTDQKAEKPDVYPIGFGLVKNHRRGTEYPPIRALLALPPRKIAKSERHGSPTHLALDRTAHQNVAVTAP